MSNKALFVWLIHTVSFHFSQALTWMMSPDKFDSAQEGIITAILCELPLPGPSGSPVVRVLFLVGGAKCGHTSVTSGPEDWSFSVALSDLSSSHFTESMMSPKRISLTFTTGPEEGTGTGSILPLEKTKTKDSFQTLGIRQLKTMISDP